MAAACLHADEPLLDGPTEEALDTDVPPFGYRYAHTLRLLRGHLPDVALRVCFALQVFADARTGHAWPSEATLADQAFASQRSIRRWLAEAIAHGLVVARPSGIGNGHAYQLTTRPYDLLRELNGQLLLSRTEPATTTASNRPDWPARVTERPENIGTCTPQQLARRRPDSELREKHQERRQAKRRAYLERRARRVAEVDALIRELPPAEARAAAAKATREIARCQATGTLRSPSGLRLAILRDAVAEHHALTSHTAPARTTPPGDGALRFIQARLAEGMDEDQAWHEAAGTYTDDELDAARRRLADSMKDCD